MSEPEESTSTYRAPKEDESSSSSSEENELNVYSMNFNPERAIRLGRDMLPRLPFPKTKRLNNLQQYQQVTNAGNVEDFESNMINALKKRPLSRKSNKYVNPEEGEKIERKFLPHQMPIKTVREQMEIKNLIFRMNSMEGPLAQLREWKDTGIRVCVKTRCIYNKGINEMIGFVMAFDKHWNIALKDVTELYVRKRKSKVPANLGPEVETVLSAEELKKRGMSIPVVIKKLGKKLEQCERYLPQCMLRGEHVMLVTPAH